MVIERGGGGLVLNCGVLGGITTLWCEREEEEGGGETDTVVFVSSVSVCEVSVLFALFRGLPPSSPSSLYVILSSI